ncbi:MAG: delta-aminolevulinic acid dehydratase [Phycisphaerae bacterium]|nr:MAG: delta-aminolevulinic acid dehydratase [Phycisphaerae bacterium]
MQRLRATDSMRNLVRETRLSPSDFIQPLFVVERAEDAEPIESMPGVVRHTVSQIGDEVRRIVDSGVPAVLLFGIPASKDATGSAADEPDGIVPEAIRACRVAAKDVVIISDVCMCSYTDHGHCGIICEDRVDNDATIRRLGEIAVSHANAGADWVAPSAMMDGMVAAIRAAMDDAKLDATGILSYAVKYASSFYGPFREAAECAPQFSDRRTYQMDPANVGEALAEANLDLDEGADILMVKPAMAYLDVIHRVKQAHPDVPLAAYQVSGEYSMIQAAAQRDWIDEKRAVLESLTAIKRAGADMIITYWASKASQWLNES